MKRRGRPSTCGGVVREHSWGLKVFRYNPWVPCLRCGITRQRIKGKWEYRGFKRLTPDKIGGTIS